jgi:hypothetical protein
MKQTLFTAFLSFMVFIAFAQVNPDTSKHIIFKGVPLDGTLNQYVAKMKQIGFDQIGLEDGTAMLQGEFAGYKACHVTVSTLKQKDLVNKIVVYFPETDTWSTLYENYSNLKELLTEKYGKPFEVLEKCERESQSVDDNSRFFQIKYDKCKYYSIWQTDKGEIRLSIDRNIARDCFVKLAYVDKVNSETIKKQAIDDL